MVWSGIRAGLGVLDLGSQGASIIRILSSGSASLSVKFKSQAGSQAVLMVRNPPANAGDVRNVGLIPGSRRSPGVGIGNPIQYSCLENPKDRGAWWVTVRVVAESDTTAVT